MTYQPIYYVLNVLIPNAKQAGSNSKKLSMNSKPEIILHHPQIELKRDKNGKTYFLIHDQDTGAAYFAFPDQVKRGWYELETKFPKAKVVLIKSTEGKKIVNLKVLTKRELWQDKYAYLCLPF